MKTQKDLQLAIVKAMKEKEQGKETLSVLRMLKASVKNKIIDLKVDNLTDEEFLKVVTKFHKDLEKEKEFIVKAGKDTSNIDNQIRIVKEYLPTLMSKEELKIFITNYLSSKTDFVNGLEERSRVGKLTGLLNKELKGKAEPKLINSVLRELL